MKKHLLFLSLLGTLVFFNACQKEVSVETGGTVSLGLLQSDIGGDCLPKNVAGIYEVNKPLVGTANYIEVTVNVIQAGSYVIYTDTINEVHFRKSGIFSTTGLNTVRLAGFGTPQVAGISNLTVTYGLTECAVAVPVVPIGGGTPAAFTFDGAPGTCTGAAATVTGNYVTGVALTSANTAMITVNVTTVGTYSITTNTSNGMVFSGASAFTSTGPQTIQLTGSGTPATAGATQIPVTNGAGSSCSFTVTVTGTPPVLTGDYFPLTNNSWWSYDDEIFVSGDSLTRLNINPITIAGNSYRIFQNQDETTPMDSNFFRKVGDTYVEINIADRYTKVIEFDDFVFGEIPFLKEGLTTNQTWQSPEFTGNELQSGLPMKLKYVFTCTDANATVTINGKVFGNVYKISWKPQYSLSGAPYQDEFFTFESYYAKGVGLIHFKLIDVGTPYEMNIRNWKVF